VIALALVGGDDRLERELAELAAQLGDVALLPEAAAGRADALLIADGQRGAALDRLRAELAGRPSRRILLVGAAGTIDLADAMASGARGVLESPLSAARLRASLAAAGCLDEAPRAALDTTGGPIVLIGAAGGCGTTTCAVALAASLEHGVLVDLDLATGDAAAVAGARIEAGDALLALAYAATVGPGELHAQLAAGRSLRVLPAPALPEQADLIDEGGVARVLDAIRQAGLQPVADAGSRVGVETLPALERASAIIIVSPTGGNGRRGVARTAALLVRLGVGERTVGIVASRVWPHRRSEASVLAEASGLPLWATIGERVAVARAARAGEPPPTGPFAGLAAAIAGIA
jgi:Flp pilus assembly CpaE family ATPase